jgi:protein-disulfide isomerase
LPVCNWNGKSNIIAFVTDALQLAESEFLMTHLTKLILTCALALGLAAGATAQTSRPNTPAQPKPVATTAAGPPPNTLAVVNGQNITLAEINSEVRDAVNNFDKDVAEMRRRALANQVNTYLFEAEAKKRNVTLEQLLNAEVQSRIPVLTEEEIRSIYDQYRSQLGNATLDEARPRIVSAVREQRAQALVDDLATRLRMMYVVESGAADVNAANLAPATVLATVAGRAITLKELNEQVQPAVNEQRLRIYEAERLAVEARVNEILMDAEARRRRITRDDLIRVEISDKVRAPSDADVTKFYEANKARLSGDLNSLRGEIARYLEQEERTRLQDELTARLRSTASVRILLPEPAGYTQRVSTDDDPARGPQSAPVTVVMFTDFQCPACSGTHPVLAEVLKQYGARVRLVVRDFPLPQHQWARKAAEAANAANAQGKFFEYVEVLYRNQQALDVASLKKYAGDLGLDRARFDADLESGKYAAEIEHDIADGKLYGIAATPTIFVNGVRLLDLGERAMKAAIDRALERAGQKPQTAAAK